MYDLDKHEESYAEQEAERTRYEQLARIALPRFPELQRGEHIGNKEISARLNAIKNLGYSIGNSRKGLNRKGLWKLLETVKEDIRLKANQYCPEVVRKIDHQNNQMRDMGRDPLLS